MTCSRHGFEGPTVPWYEIQDLMLRFKTDVLLLLDCCFAAQAGRGRDSGPYRFEILAAAAMGQKTAPPGPDSFTVALIREMEEAIARDGYVDMNQTQRRLSHRERKLIATPVHITLANRSAIRLTPRPTGSEDIVSTQQAHSSLHLQLQVQVKHEITESNIGQFKDWLTSRIPDTVFGLNVIRTTEHVQSVVADLQKGSKAFVKEVDAASKDECISSWGRLISIVKQYQAVSSLELPGSEEEETQRTKDFLDELEARNGKMKNLIERAIFGITNNLDVDALEDAAEDENMLALGMSEEFRLRKIIKYGVLKPPEPDPAESDQDPKVLHEFKDYGLYIDPKQIPVVEKRVNLLRELLSTRKSTEFRSLKCLRAAHEPAKNRLKLDFEIPEYASGPKYISLQDIIQNYKGKERPTLEQRLRICVDISKALYKWHLVGWLHQSISSRNVIFFADSTSQEVNFSSPFLHGFDFARPETDVSIGISGDDFETTIYRHPERQGSSAQRHQRKHDVYSLGVVMLEVGLWQCATDMFKSKDPAQSPLKVRERLQKNCQERLAHFVGQSYQRAVSTCLSSDFGIVADDQSGSAFLKAFREQVIEEISKGIVP